MLGFVDVNGSVHWMDCEVKGKRDVGSSGVRGVVHCNEEPEPDAAGKEREVDAGDCAGEDLRLDEGARC